MVARLFTSACGRGRAGRPICAACLVFAADHVGNVFGQPVEMQAESCADRIGVPGA